eukprot:259947-Rhodomonas_salina.2
MTRVSALSSPPSITILSSPPSCFPPASLPSRENSEAPVRAASNASICAAAPCSSGSDSARQCLECARLEPQVSGQIRCGTDQTQESFGADKTRGRRGIDETRG